MPLSIQKLANRLTFRQLQVFKAVYDLKSYSKAGDLLGLTQPAVSSQVRHLEQALGMLESLDEDSLCPRGRASQRARYLRNLLDSVYGQEGQPYLADLDRRRRRLDDRLRALRAVSSGANPAPTYMCQLRPLKPANA